MYLVMQSFKAIDGVIRRNMRLFKKTGVTSVRPGFRATGGWLTHQPAIVVSVKRKKLKVAKSQLLPKEVAGIPVDVREVTRLEALKAIDPRAFARTIARLPEGNEPADKQVAVFPLERNTKGQLITPLVKRAVAAAKARVRTTLAIAAKAKKGTYQKLPATALAEITGTFKITCAASPDAGWPTLQPFLQGVAKTLTVAMFEFTAPYIVQAVTGSLTRKQLNLVLDDPSYDTEKRDQTESTTQQQLAAALGTGLKFSWAAEGMDPHTTLALFPSAYHIKVAVKDSQAVWLSSGNWNRTNQPNITPISNPADRTTARVMDRDWHAILENPQLASVFESVILRDLAQAQGSQKSAQSKMGTTSSQTQAKPFAQFFAPQTFSGPMSVQPVLTPDNYAAVIVPLILSAKKAFWMQTQYINPPKSFATDVKKPLASRSILEQLIAALATIQARKVDVRIILGGDVTSSILELLQMYGKLDATTIRLQDNVHNKGMIIDGATTVVGSQNWSTEGVDTNRDASVVIKSTDIAAYWQQIFLMDWNDRTIPPDKPAS
jgi:hypothetical protein